MFLILGSIVSSLIQTVMLRYLDWRQAGWKSFITNGAVGRLWAFWECSCRAMYSYTGAEMLGMVAAEADRQRESLPHAAKRVSRRLMVYYVGAIIALGLTVSPQDPILATRLYTDPSRPYPGGFIIMLQRAGIHGLPHIVNLVMILASIGVANGEIFYTVTHAVIHGLKSRVGHWRH